MSAPGARRLTLDAAAIRAYSRRGNYHSEPETAGALGLPGLVAQGMQAFGPAYAQLLDAWGEDFLAHGELDVKFVGLVLEDHTVEAQVEITGGDASLTVTNVTGGHPAVVGTARRRAGGDAATA
jgi:acyl dehydratase